MLLSKPKKVVKASATVLLRLRLIHKKFEPKQPLPPMVTRFTRSATSRELRVDDRFPAPEELWERTYGEANEWTKKFASVPFSDSTREPRFYQRQAVNRALEAVAGGKKRILLTLATGTGKTFIASQVAWKLFKARWNQQRDGARSPRILLADRNVLRIRRS